MSTTPKTITAEQVTLPKDSVWRKIPLIGLVVGVLEAPTGRQAAHHPPVG